jgi:hypothetical protein
LIPAEAAFRGTAESAIGDKVGMALRALVTAASAQACL